MGDYVHKRVNKINISPNTKHTVPLGISGYLVGRVSGHPPGRGLEGAGGPGDHDAAPGEVLDPEASPRVRLVSAGVHIKSEQE